MPTKKLKSQIHTFIWAKFRKLRNKTSSYVRLNNNTTIISYPKLTSKTLSSKDWWKTLKSFLKPNDQASIPDLRHNNSLATEDTEKASLLNEYFTNKTMLDDQNVNVPYVRPNNTVMPLFQISPSEVQSVLENFHFGKASVLGPYSQSS